MIATVSTVHMAAFATARAATWRMKTHLGGCESATYLIFVRTANTFRCSLK